MLEREVAAPMLAGIGGGGMWNAVDTPSYNPEPRPAIEIASRRIASRFGVSLPLAREVCRLAQIGGVA